MESGLFGSFTALNFFHWFLFWELSLIPAFFLIKLWAARIADPPRPSSSSTPWRGAWPCSVFPRRLSLYRKIMDFGQLHSNSPRQVQLEQMVTAHFGPAMIWLAIGVLAGFAVKVP